VYAESALGRPGIFLIQEDPGRNPGHDVSHVSGFLFEPINCAGIPDSTHVRATCYDRAMSKVSSKASTTAARRWRASLIGNRLKYLGSVDAADESAAEAVAAEQFGLSDLQRKRLVRMPLRSG
jgi:hypothetical protein